MQTITNELLICYQSLFQGQRPSASLLLSPPGAGKTTLIHKLFQAFDSKKHLVLISPLRAIVSELGKRFDKDKNVEVILSGDIDCHERVKKRISRGEKLFIPTTPESLGLEFLDHFKKDDTVFIFDEIHLFHYWGESFRPYLNYFLQEIVTRNFSILCLTATFEVKNLDIFLDDLKRNYDHILSFDFGNRKLLHYPRKTSDFSLLGFGFFKRFMIRKILNDNEKVTSLIFCRSRIEVKRWREFFESRGVLALGCVGGEVSLFQSELDALYEKNKRPQVIISTLALSHGVNLPPIRHVFLLHTVEIEDFYIQMVGRGGRDGNGYELYLFKPKNWKFRFYFNAFRKAFF